MVKKRFVFKSKNFKRKNDEKTVFMDKYPICSIEFLKSEMRLSSTKEVVEYFKEKISNHPVAEFIALFDHYAHTKKLGGPIMDGLLDAQNVVFVLVKRFLLQKFWQFVQEVSVFVNLKTKS